jgi:hypothetical protein
MTAATVSGIAMKTSPLVRSSPSLLTQEEVHHPATPDVRPRLATMGEEVGLRAVRFFEDVCQDGQAVEGPLLVDALGQLDHRAIVPRQPGWIEGHRPEGVIPDTADKFCLVFPFFMSFWKGIGFGPCRYHFPNNCYDRADRCLPSGVPPAVECPDTRCSL